MESPFNLACEGGLSRARQTCEPEDAATLGGELLPLILMNRGTRVSDEVPMAFLRGQAVSGLGKKGPGHGSRRVERRSCGCQRSVVKRIEVRRRGFRVPSMRASRERFLLFRVSRAVVVAGAIVVV